MDILPFTPKDFLSENYWKQFFKKLKKEGSGNEYFEWYGNYKSFDHLYKKFIKQDDLVMHAGIGKSLLSEELYDNNICKHIVNVDYEKESLKQMRLRSEQKRPEQKFECYSLTEEIPVPDNQFDVIVDKGTLDAIYPDQSTKEVNNYLDNMYRILKMGGKLIIVSLLQEHVLKKILNPRWSIQIFETVIEKSKLYPFFVVLTKEPNKQDQVCYVELLDQSELFISYTDCLKTIKRLQLQNHFVTQIHKLRQGQSFTLDLWSALNKTIPRYTLYVYDSENAQTVLNKTCACFIIPQGREQSYMFATTQGHKELQKQAQVSRLVIARMNPGHKFQNMKLVQQELSDPMKGLIPKGCTNQPCPFMTDGDEIGDKIIIYESKDCIIEEYECDDSKYRRLILQNSLDLIQSQARIINNKVDHSYLDFEAHIGMVGAFGFNKAKEILILGGGVGLLSRFLAIHLQARVTNIEINEEVCKLAQSFFDFKENEYERMVCCDAIDYVEQAQQSKSFDLIIVDINSFEQNTISPPKPFLEKEFLQKLQSMLTDQGVIAINILDPLKELKKIEWDLYYSHKCENDLNQIYYLINTPPMQENQLDKGLLDKIDQNLKEAAAKFNQVKTWDSSLNIGLMVETIKLKYPQLKTQAFQTQDVQLVQDGEIKDQRKEFYQEDLQKVQKKKNKRKRKNK